MPARQNTFGPIKGPIVGSYLPIAASQYFAFGGGAFGDLNSSGHYTIAETADTALWGWALAPKSVTATAGLTYYLSSSTAGADKLFVIHCVETVFDMPTSTATMAASQVGELCDLISTNGATTPQYANVGTNSTDVLRVVGGDITLDIAHVVMNEATLQKDTA